jgi:hypothetical protein
MKYIITESRLEDTILKYLDRTITPFGGWSRPKDYRIELVENEGEIFFFLDEDEEKDMWYSTCYNPNVELNEDDCPIVTIPDEEYNTLTSLFEENWKPIFIKWFTENTKLPVKSVDNMGW